MDVDFGRTAGDYGRHRVGFPDVFFERLELAPEGRRVLDLGTGTGALARELAARGARVTGLDRSSELMLQGVRLGARLASPPSYVRGVAEALPFADDVLELVTAGQCWHWFDAPRVAAEVARVLTPGGCAVLCSYDWVPVEGSVVAETEALILRHNPTWSLGGGDGRHPEYAVALEEAGFRAVSSFEVDADATYSHVDWRGRIRASAGVGASLPPEGIRAFDAELRRVLVERFPGDPLRVPHRVFATLGRAT